MPEAQKTVLENGIRVLSEALPGCRSVAIGLIVETGPEACVGGLAHLCEHLLFQGTSHRDALEIARTMDGAGGRMGGFVSRDYTCYFAQVLADYGTYAIDLLGDLLLNPIFPQDALEREKRAILCEMQAAADDPEKHAHDRLKLAAWAPHPLGQSILGTPASLQTISREDLIYFLHRHYLPDRLVIAAAGRVCHEDFVAQVRDAFWRLIGAAGDRQPRPATFQRGLAHGQAEIGQAYFSLGLPAPPFAHQDRYRLHLLSQFLGGGLSSRLFRELREERGLVYGVHSSYQAYTDAGMLLIEGSTAPPELPTVLDLTLTELERLGSWQLPVDAEELQRAKIQLRSQIMLAAEDSHSRMSQLATQEIYFGRSLGEQEMLAEVEAIDARAVRETANAYLANGLREAALSILGPMPAGDRDLGEIQTRLDRYPSQQIEPSFRVA